jgi:hypothetical protein
MSYFKGIGRKSGSYTGRKLPLVGLLENKKYTIFNEYVPGSGVGASSVVTRRLKKQRARIKKCDPPEPILPELDENEYFEISDDITTFNSDLETQINALDLEMTYNLGTDGNSFVDGKSFEVIAKKHLNALATSSESTSLTFTVLSETNPAANAVNETQSMNLNTLLSSNDYNIIISEPITYTDSPISQQTSHTFIYTGNSDGKPNIEYIMSITDYSHLQ